MPVKNLFLLQIIFINIRTILRSCRIAVAVLIAMFATLPARAQAPVPTQQFPIFQKGDAVVTGYSGVALLQPAPGGKPEDFAVINQQGATLQIFDLSQMYGPDDARLVEAKRFFSATAGQIGQVFGVTLDDGMDGKGPDPVPSIYATATSVFGLQIVETANGVRNRATAGGANRSWMDGQFGIGLGGGPGSIWKIDGRTGAISLFANVTLNGVPNSGAALGNITFDHASRHLFVSDLQTGMIHAFDLTGKEVAVFDHGAKGRPRLGLPAAPYDPASRVDISSPALDALDQETWGYTPKARSVWGVGVQGGRLFYSVAEGPEIWSVGILKNGTFADDARVEVEVRAPTADAISDITFGNDGTMYLAQRGQGVASYDYTILASPQTASVLRYTKRKLPSGVVTWQPVPDEYAVGFEATYRNTNGGVALGYGYDQFGYFRPDVCEGTLWSTGELLRKNDKEADKLKPGGELIVHGLQGVGLTQVRPANEGPYKSFFIDFDSNYSDPTHLGHMGDIATWSACPGGVAIYVPAPQPPSGPHVRIAKACSAAPFGGEMRCTVTLTSTGSVAPSGRVGFSDFGEVLSGPPSASPNPLILAAIPDDPDWNCSFLPDFDLGCSISGAIMKPGQSRSVDVIMDISEVEHDFDWLVRNCATLDGTNQKKCVTRGDSDALIVTKSGPDQQPCIAGGPCDFQVSVINPGNRTFDGPLFFGDNLTINGASVAGIQVDNVFPAQGCFIAGNQIPLHWECHTTIPPGGEKLFNILLTIPASAATAGPAQGRNCFVTGDPQLLSGIGFPGFFWQGVLNPANSGFQPGRACVDFDVLPAVPGQPVPPHVSGLPQGTTMQVIASANPAVFSNAGATINYNFFVRNTGAHPVASFTLADTKATAIKCAPGNTGPNGGPLAVGASVQCTGTYKTTQADVGKDITGKATVSGTSVAGPVPTPLAADTKVRFVPRSSVSLAVTPSRTSYSAANDKIGYTYTVKNTGSAPFQFELTDTKAAGIKCPPSKSGPKGGPLTAGNSVTCIGAYTASAGDVGKDIASKASLTGTSIAGPLPATSADTVVVFVKPGKPSLSLTVAASQPSFTAAGEKITNTYTLKNTGPVDIGMFAIGDDRAADFKCSTPSPAICAGMSSGSACGSLAAGASATCTASYTTKAGDLGASISTKATLGGWLAMLTKATGAAGVLKPDAFASAGTEVAFKGKPEAPKFSLTVTPSQKTYSGPGEKIIYTFKIRNTGKVAVDKFTLTDNKVTGIKCAPANSGPNGGPLAIGATATCEGIYTTAPADANVLQITNTAKVDAKSASGAAGSATGVAKVAQDTSWPAATLTVSVSQPTWKAANESVTYTFKLTNTGTKPISKFRISNQRTNIDPPLKCPPANAGPEGGPVAVGASVTCTGVYVTKPNQLGNDLPTIHSATLWGPFSTSKNGDSRSKPDAEATVKFDGSAGIALSVTPSPVLFRDVNEKITYTYTVKNTGSLPVKSFSITDDTVTGITCAQSEIDPGKSATCSGTYTTKPHDHVKGIVSIANVAGTSGAGAIPPPPAVETTVYREANYPEVSITVTPSPATYTAANQTITYSFVVRNTGVTSIREFELKNEKGGVSPEIKCPPANGKSGPPLAVGASATCTGTYTTTAADVNDRAELKTFHLAYLWGGLTKSGDSPESSTRNLCGGVKKTAPPYCPDAESVVPFAGKPELSLVQKCSPLKFSAPGQSIVCDFTVANTGTMPVKSCQITGSRINVSCPSGGIAPGAVAALRGVYTSTQADAGKNIVLDFKLDGVTQ